MVETRVGDEYPKNATEVACHQLTLMPHTWGVKASRCQFPAYARFEKGPRHMIAHPRLPSFEYLACRLRFPQISLPHLTFASHRIHHGFSS